MDCFGLPRVGKGNIDDVEAFAFAHRYTYCGEAVGVLFDLSPSFLVFLSQSFGEEKADALHRSAVGPTCLSKVQKEVPRVPSLVHALFHACFLSDDHVDVLFLHYYLQLLLVDFSV